MSAKVSSTLLQAARANKFNGQLYAPLIDRARIVAGDSFNSISSPNGIAMLVAQLSHESAYFTRVSESLYYSVKALREGNRSKYFTQEQANSLGYVRDPVGNTIRRPNEKMIANLYYGNRNGNRGVDTDDGWDFRGAGLLQLTGRDNFTGFGKSIGKSPEEAADYARTPEGAVASALWFWRANGLLIPASRGDVAKCTLIINGGDTGLVERISLYKAALATL